ncbi:hypothetical protein [Vulgatibacter incomptus]|uniref:Uncharacterized protein n=1 Tax=Vulgatibacter incomptus TaxID=1391653 RepID=A0A0K1PBF9_9BACT|nr:hypothetical protein [Vulgatibacter incomptus]AKU90860.1 hypothetical protein AKJ08_1247 [Vulgatibacter incomptus]
MQVRLAEGRYETGVGSLLELSDAELALQQAELRPLLREGPAPLDARAALIERLTAPLGRHLDSPGDARDYVGYHP